MSAADQFNKQVDCVLLHKVHKVKVPKMEANGIDHNPKKKASSLNRIKDPKYLWTLLAVISKTIWFFHKAMST